MRTAVSSKSGYALSNRKYVSARKLHGTNHVQERALGEVSKSDSCGSGPHSSVSLKPTSLDIQPPGMAYDILVQKEAPDASKSLWGDHTLRSLMRISCMRCCRGAGRAWPAGLRAPHQRGDVDLGVPPAAAPPLTSLFLGVAPTPGALQASGFGARGLRAARRLRSGLSADALDTRHFLETVRHTRAIGVSADGFQAQTPSTCDPPSEYSSGRA